MRLSSNLLKSKIPMFSGGEGAHGKLMPNSNLLKSKIPMSARGGGGGGNQFSTFDAESKFAKKKKFLRKIFLVFGQNWNGFVLDFEYQMVPLYEV